MGEQKTAKKKMSKQQLRYLFSALIMILVTGLAVYYVLQGDTNAIINALSNAKAGYVTIMCLFVVGTYVIEGSILAILAKMYKRSYKVYQGLLNGLIGSFFSAITPFASGGQFVQAYTFSKQGIKPADSASILVMLFVVSQTMIVIYSTLAIIFGYSSTIQHMQNVTLFGLTFTPIALSFIGYAMSFLALIFMFIMAYAKWFHHFVLNTLFGLGAKMHIIKDPERKKISLAAQVATFRIEVTRLLKNVWILLAVAVLEFVKFTFGNMLPYFAGLALGDPMTNQFWPSMWSYSYLSMITSFIPIPGASGGAEVGFTWLFTTIYQDQATLSAANILCRSISFYMTLFIGFLVFIFYRGSPKKAAYQFDNRKTFVDLQIVSLSQASDPILREVTIVNPSEEPDPTQTGAMKANPEAADTNTQTIKKKKRIWPWRRLGKGKTSSTQSLMLSPQEVQHSFDEINKTLILDQKDIYKENDDISVSSQQELKKVYQDVDKIEKDDGLKDKTDTEIDLAIKADLAALKEEQDRKNKRRATREARREQRRIKREERENRKKTK
jgi:uncharacterized protein (TIRG00374 family)